MKVYGMAVITIDRAKYHWRFTVKALMETLLQNRSDGLYRCRRSCGENRNDRQCRYRWQADTLLAVYVPAFLVVMIARVVPS